MIGIRTKLLYVACIAFTICVYSLFFTNRILSHFAVINDKSSPFVESDIENKGKLGGNGVNLDLKLERMAMYNERYKYQPPVPYTNHTARDILCGSSPGYDSFFTRPDRNHISSGNGEDKSIYDLFFKEDPSRDNSTTMGSVVEMGAYNGLQESNSRFYEVCLGWETLLVEGNALLWEKLVSNRPHAHRFSFAPSCSEEEERANKTVKFDKYPMLNAGLADGSVTTSYTSRNSTIDVPCGSLTKVLLDILNGHVSFFSLDVEGAEPFVVQNIDFDKVFIEVMMIEMVNGFCGRICKHRDDVRKLMKEAGYILFVDIAIKSDVYIHPRSKHLQTAERKGFKSYEI